jgi:hypothetical protein
VDKAEEEARNKAADYLARELKVTLAREGTMTGPGAEAIARIARRCFVEGWIQRAEYAAE